MRSTLLIVWALAGCPHRPPPPLPPPVLRERTAEVKEDSALLIVAENKEQYPLTVEVVADDTSQSILARLLLPGNPVVHGNLRLDLFYSDLPRPDPIASDHLTYHPISTDLVSMGYGIGWHLPPGRYRLRAQLQMFFHESGSDRSLILERVQNATFVCPESICAPLGRCSIDEYSRGIPDPPKTQGMQTLSDCLERFPRHLIKEAYIIGHASAEGSTRKNCRLGHQRANQLVDLVEDTYGLPRTAIEPLSHGEYDLVFPQDKGSAANRRVEIYLRFVGPAGAPETMDPRKQELCPET